VPHISSARDLPMRVDGNSRADFQVVRNGRVTLQASNFWL
jgi:hypothetical protein